MSIASHADILCGPHALSAGAATSRLDRELASLAGLGAAIRDEIAQSLAPMKAELEMARNAVSMLEVRVRDLEARPAATAVAVCDPDLPHHATGRAVETPPESTPERAETLVANRQIVEDEIASGAPNQPESAAAHEAQGGLGAATGTASLGPQAHDPVPLSAATGAAAEQQMPAEAPTRRRKPRKVAAAKSATVAPAHAVTITLVLSPGVSTSAAPVSVALAPSPQLITAAVSISVAATVPAAPVVDTPDPVSESSLPAPAVADFPEQAPAANERSEPVPAASEPSRSAVLPFGDSHGEMGPDAADALSCEHAAKILHPLLEAVSISVAATVPAAPVVDTPDPVSESSLPAPAVADFPEQAPAANERSEPVPAASEPSRSAVLQFGDSHGETGPGAAEAMSCEHATRILHPLLEKGAGELIAFGLYPDMAALLDEAVYRLLESDYPADPGG